MKKTTSNKMPKGQGWYTYEDGYQHWVNGMSNAELKIEVRKHGKVISYRPGF